MYVWVLYYAKYALPRWMVYTMYAIKMFQSSRVKGFLFIIIHYWSESDVVCETETKINGLIRSMFELSLGLEHLLGWYFKRCVPQRRFRSSDSWSYYLIKEKMKLKKLIFCMIRSNACTSQKKAVSRYLLHWLHHQVTVFYVDFF